MKWTSAGGGLVLLLALSGCLTASGPGNERSENLEKWRAQGITGYEVRYGLSCFCIREATEPVLLRVRNRALVSVTRLVDGASVPADQWEGRYYTVEQMFALIEDAHRQGFEQVRVSYHPSLGYPTEVLLDQSTRIADEERSFELSGLTPLR